MRTDCEGSLSRVETDGTKPNFHLPLVPYMHSNDTTSSSAQISKAVFSDFGPLGDGGSLYFSGEKDCFLQITDNPDNPVLGDGKSFSWIMSIRPTDTSSSSDRVIFQFEGDANGNGLKAVQRQSDLVIDIFNIGGENLGQLVHPDFFKAAQWTYMAVVSTTGWEGLETVYLDSYNDPQLRQRKEKFETISFDKPEIINTKGLLRFGSPLDGQPEDAFLGHIACIMFHNKALYKSAFKRTVEDCDSTIWSGMDSVVRTSGFPVATTALASTNAMFYLPIHITEETSTYLVISNQCQPSETFTDSKYMKCSHYKLVIPHAIVDPQSLLKSYQISSTLQCSSTCAMTERCRSFSFVSNGKNNGSCRLSSDHYPKMKQSLKGNVFSLV